MKASGNNSSFRSIHRLIRTCSQATTIITQTLVHVFHQINTTSRHKNNAKHPRSALPERPIGPSHTSRPAHTHSPIFLSPFFPLRLLSNEAIIHYRVHSRMNRRTESERFFVWQRKGKHRSEDRRCPPRRNAVQRENKPLECRVILLCALRLRYQNAGRHRRDTTD